VPLARIDEAVFVQHEVGQRYGLFIEGAQAWLSGADFCEMDTELLSTAKVILCGGHCHTTKLVPLWAATLEQEVEALPAVGNTVAAPARDRNLTLQQARQLLSEGGSVEAMCHAVNQLLSLPSPNDKIRVRTRPGSPSTRSSTTPRSTWRF
jgi:hypothetical protein